VNPRARVGLARAAALAVLAALVLPGCAGSPKQGGPRLAGNTLEVAAVWSGAEQRNFEKVLAALMRDAGLPATVSCGFAEITPERDNSAWS
jgi:alpha-glucoside transport system substrate-binding protein